MNEQINIRIPKNLLDAATSYSKEFGYANIQELIKEHYERKYMKTLALKKNSIPTQIC